MYLAEIKLLNYTFMEDLSVRGEDHKERVTFLGDQ